MNANSTSNQANPQGSKTFDTNRENIFTQVILSEAEYVALVAVAESAKHWEVCDFPDEVDFRCEGCNKARAAYAALAAVREGGAK